MTRNITVALRGLNALVLTAAAGMYSTVGIPDRYIAHPLYNGWVEFKGEFTHVTPQQHEMLRMLQERGTNCVIVRYIFSRDCARIETPFASWDSGDTASLTSLQERDLSAVRALLEGCKFVADEDRRLRATQVV